VIIKGTGKPIEQRRADYIDTLRTRLEAVEKANGELVEALREIKLHCLTTDAPYPRALGHIVRLCIEAGIRESYPEIERLLATTEALKGEG